MIDYITHTCHNAFEFTFPGHLDNNTVINILDDLVDFLDIKYTYGFRVDVGDHKLKHKTDSDGDYTLVTTDWGISGYGDNYYDKIELHMEYDRDKAEEFLIKKYNDLNWDTVEIFEDGPTFKWSNFEL